MWDDLHPYAIGDIHGELALLQRLLDRIPREESIRLIFLGDYLDRGEDSIGTITYLADLATQRDCIFLRGNHDAAWLESWNGERFVHRPVIPGARTIWEQYNGQIPAAVGRFLERTQIDWEDEFAYYSHAGAAPDASFRRTPAEIKVWGDSRFLASSYDWGKPIVFGHFELTKPLITATKIGLDTAAYRTGILTAMGIIERRIIQVKK
jgi:serine/threonine protein phosphatase 1